MVITNKYFPGNLQLKTSDSILNRVEKQNFLDISIGQKLTFKTHIDSTCKKVSKSIGILYKFSPYVLNKILVNLYFTLIQSHCFYGINSWESASPSNLSRIMNFQRRAVKLISGDYDENF